MDVSLWEAWALWRSGEPLLNHTLWGLEILWWGRIGKVTQLVAAMTIIAEIIGPENLRSFGTTLNPRYPIKRVKQELHDSIDFVKLFYGYIGFTKREVSRKQLRGHSLYDRDALVLFPTSLIFTIFLLYTLYRHEPVENFLAAYEEWWFLILVVKVVGFIVLLLVNLFALTMLSPALTLMLTVIFIIPGMLVDFLLIRPVAALLTVPRLERWIKVGSLLFLLAGFHFDLLAS